MTIEERAEDYLRYPFKYPGNNSAILIIEGLLNALRCERERRLPATEERSKAGNPCPKCGLSMERRGNETRKKPPKPGRCYYSEWDYCVPCGHLQHYKEFLVIPGHRPKRTEAQYRPASLEPIKETNIGPDNGTDLPWD